MHKSYRYLEDKISRRYFSIMVSLTALVGLVQLIVESSYREQLFPVFIGVAAAVPLALFPFYMKARTIEASSNFVFSIALGVQTVFCFRLLFHDGMPASTLLWMVIPALYTLVYTDNRKTLLACLHMAALVIVITLLKVYDVPQTLGMRAEVLGDNSFTRFNYFFPLVSILIFLLSYSFDRKRIAKKMEDKELRLASWAKFASLGEMSSGMAHEINNPVAILKGYLQVLRRRLEKESSKTSDYSAILGSCDEAINRINNIIRSLKSISHQDNHEVGKSFELTTIWEEVETLCQYSLRLSDVKLDLTVHLSTDQKLHIQFTHLLQVLVNLINNARDAVSTLPERWVKVSFRGRKNGMLEICVMDSGLGIPSEVLSMLFTPFYTTKELGKGTGLGLTLSAKMVESMGGKLFYELRQGHTCFVITLPKALISEGQIAA